MALGRLSHPYIPLLTSLLLIVGKEPEPGQHFACQGCLTVECGRDETWDSRAYSQVPLHGGWRGRSPSQGRGQGRRREAQGPMSTGPASGAGQPERSPPPAHPAPPPGAGAAVSEWHWQPVNPSAERPSSPVRRGCWLGARLRRWRRRLLPPHQSAVRPACGPPGPSTGLRAPAASTRPLPNFPPPPLSLPAARPSASSSSAAAAAPSPGPPVLGSRPVEPAAAAAGS